MRRIRVIDGDLLVICRMDDDVPEMQPPVSAGALSIALALDLAADRWVSAREAIVELGNEAPIPTRARIIFGFFTQTTSGDGEIEGNYGFTFDRRIASNGCDWELRVIDRQPDHEVPLPYRLLTLAIEFEGLMVRDAGETRTIH